MAANDVLAAGFLVNPPAADHMRQNFRLGGSTPAENFETWLAHDTTVQSLDFHGVMSPKYTTTSLKVRFCWYANTATTGVARWEASFRRVDTGEDIDTAHGYTFLAANSTAPATLGAPAYVEITFTSSQIDSLAPGERFVLRVRRISSDVADTMTGDAEIDSASLIVFEA
jgi:hypothetical protein